MSLRVVGAGFGRTGTLSLKLALEQLGIGPSYHMMEIPKQPEHAALWLAASRGERVDWDEIFAGYSAAVDWPSCVLWRELLRAYPDARVILTVREAESWYASFRETILPRLENLPPVASPAIHALYDLGREVILRRTFGGRAGDAHDAIEAYEAHNAQVIAALDAERLLVYDVAAGWEPLCAFLGDAGPRRRVPAHEFARELCHGLARQHPARRPESQAYAAVAASRTGCGAVSAEHVGQRCMWISGRAAAHGRHADERVTGGVQRQVCAGSARALRSAAARCGTRGNRARPRDRSRAPSSTLL